MQGYQDNESQGIATSTPIFSITSPISENMLAHLEKDKLGIACIDKPTGWTSHDVVSKVRRITGVKRVGHAGTLDPLATGLLIVLIGREFTRMQSIFLKQPKEYVVTAQFGITTDSYDSDGKILTKVSPQKIATILDQQKINQAMKPFIGNSNQQVPLFSAVKVRGKKLYEHGRKQRARQNNKTIQGLAAPESVQLHESKLLPINTINLPIKKVVIHSFELLNLDPPYAEFRVYCSSGTYIRSLLHDLGKSIGIGATVTKLRRTKIGVYDVKKAIKEIALTDCL